MSPIQDSKGEDYRIAKTRTSQSTISKNNSSSLSDRLRLWCKMIETDSAHPDYTKELLNKAADLIDTIDRECSLSVPLITYPYRIKRLIRQLDE